MPRRSFPSLALSTVAVLAAATLARPVWVDEAAAQGTTHPTPSAVLPAATAAVDRPSRGESLAALHASIARAESDIAELRKQIKNAPEGDVEELEARREARERDLERLEERFVSVATDIELEDLSTAEAADLDLSAELRELLAPIINELKRATTRPRELDRLGREIDELRERVALAGRALENLDAISDATDRAVARRLEEIRREWIEQKNRLEDRLHLAEERRDRLLGQRTSIVETLENLTQVFFRSRGRNLLLAAIAFGLVWLTVHFVHRLFQRFSPLHGETRRLAARIIDLAFVVGSAVGGTLAALAVLYWTGDWVLLTIFSLFLVGVAWASRTTLPRIWRQVMILMNLGGVREGERIVYQGIPYKVDRLGFYTYLRNPALSGGLLRLPLTHIAELHTRPFDRDERWFPTAEDDWILLPDGTHAKVIKQSHDFVTLVTLGGARRLISSSELIEQSPTVLAAGFRLAVTFGIDYQHQALITGEIPATIERLVLQGLQREGHGDLLRNLRVEFEAAGASSLDVALLADFDGEAGAKYFILKRLLQRLCVDACNENGWVIPFTQVTMHMATPVDLRGVGENDCRPDRDEDQPEIPHD